MKTQHIQWITMLSLVFMLTGCPSTSDNDPTENTPITLEPTAQETAIEKIEAYATTNGTSDAPTTQDYIDARVTGLDDTNLADMNQVVENLTADEVDTKEELQALADALGISIDTTAPVFTSSADTSVNENQTSALTLIATDESTITYSISGTDAASFSVDASTGVVSFDTAPDFETKNSYTFIATAADEVSNASIQNITITILDINENAPTTITHNGIGYNTVTSPHTGKVWLDRNLGATQLCIANIDSGCFGDYYQWGRETDGHENPLSETIDSRIITGTKFVIGFADWRINDSAGIARSIAWAKTDGSSVCPTGFRVPISPEFNVEDNLAFLNLPASGRRNFQNGVLQPNNGGLVFNGYGNLWTNSPGSFDGTHYVVHRPGFFNVITQGIRGMGYNVRCIQD